MMSRPLPLPLARGRRLLAAALLLGGLHAPLQATGSLWVVVSADSPLRSISQKEVLALYTGRARTHLGGVPATPLDQRRDGPAREAFYQALTGMDIGRINTYWARLHYTGQVQPPQPVHDDAAVVQRLRGDPSAIGYLTHEPQDTGLRVLMRLP